MSRLAQILILEPDQALQALLDSLLRRDDLERVFVPDGVAAVEAIRLHDFAAFIVDLSLAPSALEAGARRGAGFLHHLQQHSPALLRRVIVISALAPAHVPRDLPAAGWFLHKPFDIEDLRGAVDDCLAADAAVAS